LIVIFWTGKENEVKLHIGSQGMLFKKILLTCALTEQEEAVHI
jgi:hypothetical protein